MNDNLLRRYERNLEALTLDDMKKINSSRICVIGCGGLGGFIIENLGRLGIHNITTVDGDIFEITNLNRQILSQDALIGKSKATAAKTRMECVNPNVRVIPVKAIINKDNAEEILKGHNVVIDAVDNIDSKLLIQDTCEKLKIPFIHGAIGGWFGQVSTILPGDRTLDFIYGRSKNREKTPRMGNLSFVAAVTASIQCSEAVKVIIGKSNILSGKLLYLNLLDNTMDIIEIK